MYLHDFNMNVVKQIILINNNKQYFIFLSNKEIFFFVITTMDFFYLRTKWWDLYVFLKERFLGGQCLRKVLQSLLRIDFKSNINI